MATYNGAEYLSEQLESLASQTLLPDELIISDDRSSDATIAIARAFAKTAPFSVTIHSNADRLGHTRNFERAALLCSGDLIFFCDQDDVWFDNKIEQVVGVFESHTDVMVVMNDVVITDENLQSSGHTQVANIEKSPLPLSSYVQGCASAHRAEWRDVALPLPSDGQVYGHDIFINLLAFELDVLRLMRTPLQFYRRHGSNASQSQLSNPNGISQLRNLATHGLADARPGWRHRIRIVDALIQRMKDIGSSGLGPSGLPLESTIERLEREKRALIERIDFCSIDRSPRAKRIWSFWRKGGYAVASGWKSALKDLVRPSPSNQTTP